MIHCVTGYAIVPPSQYGDSTETDVCYSVQHGLEAEFGQDGWGFETWTVDCGPSVHSSGAVLVEFQFEADLPERSLDARLSEFRAGGKNEAGEWDIPLERYAID